jgi:Do/DeqQ family serine protease
MRIQVLLGFLALIALPLAAHAEVDPIRRSPVVEAVKRVSPAVVNVSTVTIVARQTSPFPAFRDPLFDEFFHDFFEPRVEQYKQTSLGSGVIIRPDGYILTNQHVVLRGSQIKVALADDRDFEAQLVGADSDSDLAVLKVKTDKPLPYINMGNSDDLMIGETVIAIGNPFGLSHTVTTGVVSALGRSLKSGDQTYYDFIQTDASINPGNSGGPLLNLSGDLIGINTAIYQKAQGIGFAIPISRARRIVTDLISYGEVHVPWVGAVVRDLTPALATRLGIPPRRKGGVVVRRVESGSPAADAGITPGEVITAIDGRDVHTAEEYEQRIRDHAESGPIEFTIAGENGARQVTLHARRFPPERADALAWQLIGVRLAETRNGLRVDAVRPQSPAARIGVEVDDAIVALAGAAVHTLEEFRRRMTDVRLARGTLVSIRRGPYVYQVDLPFTGNAG